jgi:putative membrane protein
MSFVDDLGLVLDLMILVTAAIFYTGALVWLEVRRKDPVRAQSHLREGAVLLGILGALLGLIALWGEFLWPLPGAYNVLFFDPLIMLAILLVAFSLAVWFRLPTHLVGMLGVIIGLGVLFYGFRADELNLTKDPLETWLMYLAWGGLSIMSYPATLFIDWFVVGPSVAGADPLPSNPTPDYPKLWMGLLGLFMIAVFLAGLAAVLYGITTTWGHLGSPP